MEKEKLPAKIGRTADGQRHRSGAQGTGTRSEINQGTEWKGVNDVTHTQETDNNGSRFHDLAGGTLIRQLEVGIGDPIRPPQRAANQGVEESDHNQGDDEEGDRGHDHEVLPHAVRSIEGETTPGRFQERLPVHDQVVDLRVHGQGRSSDDGDDPDDENVSNGHTFHVNRFSRTDG